MQIWGLTGGMASGKSSVAEIFRRAGVPVFDADACVRQLQAPYGKALPAIESVFPGVVQEGQLDRAALRAVVVQQPEVLGCLEMIIHPMVAQERQNFLRHCRAHFVRLCVLDVPLLWETGNDKSCHRILVTEAPLSVRLARIRRRAKAMAEVMSESEARCLIARQMSDAERRKRADIVLRTGLSRGYVAQHIHALLQQFYSF